MKNFLLSSLRCLPCLSVFALLAVSAPLCASDLSDVECLKLSQLIESNADYGNPVESPNVFDTKSNDKETAAEVAYQKKVREVMQFNITSNQRNGAERARYLGELEKLYDDNHCAEKFTNLNTAIAQIKPLSVFPNKSIPLRKPLKPTKN